MSLYSAGVKTRDMDPNTFNQSLATFKLPANSTMYPNLRLFNVGCSDPTNAGHNYNEMCGSYSVIKHITLTSQGQEIDACRNVNRYISFLQLNNSNEQNVCVESKESKNALGFEFSVADNVQSDATETTSVGNAAAQSADKYGYLDLRKALPILNNINILDTRILKNLTLTVEFEQNSQIIVRNDALSLDVDRPILIYDEVTDPAKADSLMKAFKGVVWNKIEHDQFSVPAVAVAAAGAQQTQIVSSRMEMYSGKFISRMMVSKMFQDLGQAEAKKTGGMGSVACQAEALNIKVDGARIFPTDISRENSRLAILCDAYGEINMSPYGNNITVGLDDPSVAAVNKIGVEKLQGTKQGQFVGNLAFYGMAVNAKVQDLEVNFSRQIIPTGVAGGGGDADRANAANQAALTINTFAEVRKSLVLQKDNSIRVSYL